ncbi:Peptidoglycan/xylan/chitin deacetylase, PgdA/CDA1 family [Paenibacillus sp. 1_12]|uniref:polysaccharide deacetylase family protein n=1 Tax=Paenibacillus sp. 1_12 TaxID=1566278 RepID=UPI0008DFE33B|nr:polysaccharide deacetylase family protein [Paenibacillus sp. 1_12]SFL14952.1 Peptidoglycan/xylan/chitin deacetylase, PgdA/CDA1 family [Paenibacillus sp. 1_12]
MNRLLKPTEDLLKNAFIAYRWYILLLCCLLLLICLSWSRLISPSVRSAESDVPLRVQTLFDSPMSGPLKPSVYMSMFPNTSTVPAAPANDTASPTVSTSTSTSTSAPAPAFTFTADSSQVSSLVSGNSQLQETTQPAADEAAVEQQPQHIPVLNYHSITIDPGNRAVITPAKFEEQMLYLSNNGYHTLTLQQFIDYMDGKTLTLPKKPVLLTFDDGYADNYEHALPLLKQLNFHATLFVSPGTTEDGYFLNWDQIKEMHEAGWDIQPHGMTHPHLPKLSAKSQAFEISESKRQIDEQLNIDTSVFCYPFGEKNETTLKLLKEYGFRFAFTIDQGMTTREQGRLLLKRLFVNGEESIEPWIARLEHGTANVK